MALNDTRIRNAAKKATPYKLTDAKGLYIEIRPTGAKLWRYRYRINSKENVYAMGEYCQSPIAETPFEAEIRRQSGRYTLEEARQERLRARALVKQGIHPSHDRDSARAARQAESINTFEAIAREWIEKNKAHWSTGYAKQAEDFLTANVFPHIGALPIRQVTAAQLLEILQRVEKRGAEVVAISIRQLCSAIFAHAVRTLRADGDPTIVLKGVVKRPPVKHKTPLTPEDIPEFLKKINGRGRKPTEIAIRLLLLTFVRPTEMSAAEWTEFDLKKAEWRIPSRRMKEKELHIVPLSTQALALLRELKKITGEHKHLFPNARDPETHMDRVTLNNSLRRFGFANRFSAHGFRATASTLLNELGFNQDWVERQLSHRERNKVRASYNQAQHMVERRQMMQQWADMIDTWAKGDNVTPIRKQAA